MGTYSFKAFNYPGYSHTKPIGINDSGHIVGQVSNYRSSTRSFLKIGDNATEISYPKAGSTFVGAINNNGDIVGVHSYAAGSYRDEFKYVNGNYREIFLSFEFLLQTNNVRINGINDSGDILVESSNMGHSSAFLVDGNKATEIGILGSTSVVPTDINDSDQCVGWFENPTGTHGFSYRDGTYIQVDFPNATDTFIDGVSETGQIVGHYSIGNLIHGFSLQNSIFTSIDVPGANRTYVSDVNASGKIIGYYEDEIYGFHGFEAAPVRPVRNDTDGDGRGDLIFQNADGTVAVWTMDGAAITAAAPVSGAYAPPGWLARGTGDLNGDLQADMLLQNTTSGAASVWAMSGSTAQATAVLSMAPGPDWVLLGSGDLNGDGKGDLVFQNTSTNAVDAWLMNGATITSATLITQAYAPPGWAVKAIGDLNGDGKADLVFQNSDSTAIAVWTMDGASVLSASVVSGTPGPGWQVVGSGDLDGDGEADLVFQNSTTNEVHAWLMDGATVAGHGPISGAFAPPGWSLQGVEDLNADGKADLVFHDTDGRLAAWLMDGLTATSTAVLGINPGPSWRVVGGEPGDIANAAVPDQGGVGAAPAIGMQPSYDPAPAFADAAGRPQPDLQPVCPICTDICSGWDA